MQLAALIADVAHKALVVFLDDEKRLPFLQKLGANLTPLDTRRHY